MWTTTGLVGLVLMLLVSVETKSSKEQSLQIDNGLRKEFNNNEKLQEVIFEFYYLLWGTRRPNFKSY